MRILLITPLYPPDIADPAPYVKELATRLGRAHTVSVLAYNHLPEKVPNVTVHTIEKSSPLPTRLFRMFFAIIKHGRTADVLYVQNGPSTELPAAFATLFLWKPYILRLGDEAALMFAEKKLLIRITQRFAMLRARINVVHSTELNQKVAGICGINHTTYLDRPPKKPEILPFRNRPNAELGNYERAWKAHTETLTSIFTTCRK